MLRTPLHVREPRSVREGRGREGEGDSNKVKEGKGRGKGEGRVRGKGEERENSAGRDGGTFVYTRTTTPHPLPTGDFAKSELGSPKSCKGILAEENWWPINHSSVLFRDINSARHRIVTLSTRRAFVCHAPIFYYVVSLPARVCHRHS